jgi:hypothetical protein
MNPYAPVDAHDVPAVTPRVLERRNAQRVRQLAALNGGYFDGDRPTHGRPARPVKVIDGRPHFLCAGPCGLDWQPASAFGKNRLTRHGITSRCRACISESKRRT